MKFKSFASTLFLLLPYCAGAQWCGFDEMHARRMVNDTAYASAVNNMNQGWIDFQQQRSLNKEVITGFDTTFILPVVLHVMHNGEPVGSPENPSDQQLIDLIKYTDAVFDASWPRYPTPATGGYRTGVRLVLAQIDPDCKSTTGIVRVNASSVSNYTTFGINCGGNKGANATAVKNLSFWRNSNYLNVWLVNKFDCNIGGYAEFPGSLYNIGYGAHILVGTAQAGNTTLAHEIGHMLSVIHTFSDDSDGYKCPPLNNCLSTGDVICDTEPDKRYPNCSSTINGCTGLPYQGVQYNVMNYTACPNRFTRGQAERMKYSLVNHNIPFAYSNAGDPPKAFPAMIPAKCITSRASNFDSMTAIAGPCLVSFSDLKRSSTNCREEGAKVYVDNTCQYRGQVVAGSTYSLRVKVSGMAQNIRVYLDYNNDGDFQIPKEEIMAGSTSAGWTATTPVTIPRTGVVLNKPLRLRVVSEGSIGSSVIIGPCAALKNGQAEDYAVTINPGVGVQNTTANFSQTISPNPAQAVVNISFEQPFSGEIAVYNTIGQVLSTFSLKGEKSLAVDTHAFSDGIYYFISKNNSGVQCSKVTVHQ